MVQRTVTAEPIVAPAVTRAGAGTFALYAMAGAMIAFGLGAAFTPFILLAPIGAAILVVLLLRRRTGAALFGLLSGTAVVPAWIAWTNRPQADASCTTSRFCIETSGNGHPLPALLVAVLVLTAGLILFAVTRRR